MENLWIFLMMLGVGIFVNIKSKKEYFDFDQYRRNLKNKDVFNESDIKGFHYYSYVKKAEEYPIVKKFSSKQEREYKQIVYAKYLSIILIVAGLVGVIGIIF